MNENLILRKNKMRRDGVFTNVVRGIASLLTATIVMMLVGCGNDTPPPDGSPLPSAGPSTQTPRPQNPQAPRVRTSPPSASSVSTSGPVSDNPPVSYPSPSNSVNVDSGQTSQTSSVQARPLSEEEIKALTSGTPPLSNLRMQLESRSDLPELDANAMNLSALPVSTDGFASAYQGFDTIDLDGPELSRDLDRLQLYQISAGQYLPQPVNLASPEIPERPVPPSRSSRPTNTWSGYD